MERMLIIHILLSLILPINIHRSRSKSEYIFGFLICLLFPVGGYLISLRLNYSKDSVESMDEEDIDLLVVTDLYKKESTDIVSIEDSLLFNDTADKRRSIVNILKRDIDSYISQLKRGLGDEDSETAHYAASAISEFTRALDLKLQEIAFLYEQDKENIEIADEYFHVLKKYIEAGVLEGVTREQYLYTLINVLIEMIDNGHHKAEYYAYLIKLLIETDDKIQAMAYTDLFFDLEESETAYMLKLEILYNDKDFDGFKVVFNQLLASELVFSREMLNYVRFWKGVARYENG